MPVDTPSSLIERLRDKSWTPPRARLPDVVDALDADDKADRKTVVNALLRVGDDAAAAALERLDTADAGLRRRITRLLDRFAQRGHTESREALVGLLDDDDDRVRRAAVLAVGKWTDLERPRERDLESRLIDIWRSDPDLPMCRALVQTLGRVGGERARLLLKAMRIDDPELRRLTNEAQVFLHRRMTRTDELSVDLGKRLGFVTPVEVRCRRGLEHILADELLDRYRLSRRRPGRVTIEDFDGPPAELFDARTMLDFAFVLPPEPVTDEDGAHARAVATALCRDRAWQIMSTFSGNNVRYRIDWRSSGKRRGATWNAVQLVAARCPELVNDPSNRQWDVEVVEHHQDLHIALRPRLDDPRFEYRVDDVPAASHPTIAAALVHLGGASDDDVVWDPFVGSGLELCERAILGPWSRLIGTDLDTEALAAARRNLDHAGARGAELVEGDALEVELPERIDLIVTNPPFGQRVGTPSEARALLEGLLRRAASVLSDAGRLVWITPFADSTDPLAASLGLEIVEQFTVDVGGHSGTMQRLQRAG